MTLYALFDSPERDAADTLPAIVPERFSWFAAVLPPLYGLVHGLWLGLAIYVAGVIVLALAGAYIGGDAARWLYSLFAVFIGFEAPALRRAALARRGWRFRAEVIAADADLALLEGEKFGKTAR